MGVDTFFSWVNKIQNKTGVSDIESDVQPSNGIPSSGVLKVGYDFANSIFTGSILSKMKVRRQYPLLAYIVLLMMMYISHNFSVLKLYREHSDLTQEVKELRAVHLTLASKRMETARQSNILRMLKAKGSKLEESVTPNVVIEK